MNTYKISLLRGTKLKPELAEVTTVMADYYIDENKRTVSMFSNGVSFSFWQREENWLGIEKSPILLATLPASENWIVEQQ